MAFKLDDIIIDRIQMAYAYDFNDNPLYVLTQLSDATIEIQAESKESRDKDGTLIKKFWQGKAGTFSATNAMLNLNVIGEASGSGKVLATTGNKIVMPALKIVKAGSTATLKGYKEGTAVVSALGTNGSMNQEKKYTAGTVGTNGFSVTSDGKFTPPTDTDETQYVVKYMREVTSGAAIYNQADKFPRTVRLLIKALAVDPCSADTVRGLYIELPSFQVSPEVSISLTTDGTLNYTGDLQVDYCSANKELYRVFWADDDEE